MTVSCAILLSLVALGLAAPAKIPNACGYEVSGSNGVLSVMAAYNHLGFRRVTWVIRPS